MKFCTIKKSIHYIALVETVGENHILRRRRNKFIFLSLLKRFMVDKNVVLLKLYPPTGGTSTIA